MRVGEANIAKRFITLQYSTRGHGFPNNKDAKLHRRYSEAINLIKCVSVECRI